MTKKIVNMHTMKLQTMSARRAKQQSWLSAAETFKGWIGSKKFFILIMNNQYLLMVVHKMKKPEQLSGIQPELFSSQFK